LSGKEKFAYAALVEKIVRRVLLIWKLVLAEASGRSKRLKDAGGLQVLLVESTGNSGSSGGLLELDQDEVEDLV